MGSDPISSEEKRQALERVLDSRTFTRSDQLRGFLRYICEAEFEGRAHELNEYALGVSVLGRPANYSPAEDSCVRSRAYELRNKLKSYYRAEAPADPIQIEIDKGAYIPRFERRAKPTGVEPSADSADPGPTVTAEPPAAMPINQRSRYRPGLSAAALVIAVLLVSISAYLFRLAGRKTPGLRSSSREMEALWKPFLDSSVPLLVSFDIRLFFFAPDTGLVVRDFRTNQAAEAAQSKPLLEFQERMGAHELRETYDYADFGAVHAGFLIGRLLNRDVALKHSSALGWEDIYNSNIVFIGKPNLNPTIRYALRATDFVDELVVIRNLHPLPGESPEYWNAATHGSGEKYALISVLPGPQPGRHMMILSGAGAELMWALAESVANPARVKEIMSHVLRPSGECPEAFQVLIQARFEANVPVNIRYVTHRVSKAN
jgi:hypothetical protein